MSPKDVITIQLGETANYVGAHFWNIQCDLLLAESVEATHEGQVVESPKQRESEVDERVLFECYVDRKNMNPRLISWDVKGCLPRRVRRAVDDSCPLEWAGRVDDYCLNSTDQSSREADGVDYDYFSNFMRISRDQYSLHIADRLWRGDIGEYSWGSDGGLVNSIKDETAESIRVMAEKSDYLEGFMHVVEDASFWGNVSEGVLEDLADEYKGKMVYLFACRNYRQSKINMDASMVQRRCLLEGLAVSHLAPLVNAYIPLYDASVLPFTSPGSKSPRLEHTFKQSILKAFAIHGSTLPFRLRDGPSFGSTGMLSHASWLTHQFNSPFCIIDMTLPFVFRKEESLDNSFGEKMVFNDARLKDPRKYSTKKTLANFSKETNISFMDQDGTAKDIDAAQGVHWLSYIGLYDRKDEIIRALRDNGRRKITFTAAGIPDMSGYFDCLQPNVAFPSSKNGGFTPSMVRIASSRTFKLILDSMRGDFMRAATSYHGKSTLESWSLPFQDISEIDENLAFFADRYIDP
eukprot:jgi/Picsp_1/1113/NSC_04595-R1_tubulin-like protein